MAGRKSPSSSCPACGGPRVARIQYGLPDFSPELELALDEGWVVLGGCTVFGGDPEWQCVDCAHRWGRIEWPDPPIEPPPDLVRPGMFRGILPRRLHGRFHEPLVLSVSPRDHSAQPPAPGWTFP